MTLCIVTGVQCVCQPADDVCCPENRIAFENAAWNKIIALKAERDALKAENERMRAELDDAISDYNACVEDMHEIRETILAAQAENVRARGAK